jgi:ATP-binding cassette subfamily C protein LapB
VSARDLQAQSAQLQPDATPAVAACVLQGHGFHIHVSNAPAHQLPTAQLPMLLLLKGGEVVCWQSVRGETLVLRRYAVNAPGPAPSAAAVESVEAVKAVPAQPDGQAVQEDWTWADLLDRYAGTALLVEPDELHDAQNAGDAGRQKAHWFWGVFGLLRRYYGDCVVAAMLINLLALAGSMFSMNVYDRVIPNAALPTLWVLAIGVTVAGLLEFGLRTLRAHVVDEAGKRADLLLSAAIFRKTLDLKAQDRPTSSGQYAGQVREFD